MADQITACASNAISEISASFAEPYAYRILDLPPYVRQLIDDVLASDPPHLTQLLLGHPPSTDSDAPKQCTIPLVPHSEIPSLPTRNQQYLQLILRRHHLTHTVIPAIAARDSDAALSPELVSTRAKIHDALGYPELAIGDALAAFTVCEYEDDGGDLTGMWSIEADKPEDVQGGVRIYRPRRQDLIARVKIECAELLIRCLQQLRAQRSDIERWEAVLKRLKEEAFTTSVGYHYADELLWGLFDDSDAGEETEKIGAFSTGSSRREIYPWNEYEGDRMNDDALGEINSRLNTASQGMLQVRKSFLPNLTTPQTDNEGKNTLATATAKLSLCTEHDAVTSIVSSKEENTNAQLGLFAIQDLPPNTTILTERSALTAIRPHGASLCDACAGELNTSTEEPHTCHICPANCGITFCSRECLDLATSTYHTPNIDDEETDEGYPPASAPFCPGESGGEADIANLGRAESSTSPEWDLYFLLVVRALQMAETLDVHPLQIWECRWLWGDFNEGINLNQLSGEKVDTPKKTLPFSLHHHVELPLQWFELLMLSRTGSAPYSRKWLKRYDWWVIQTLYAKFRGVADAKLSSWSGEPETASVYPLWCLANHSCEASVTWEGGGVRRLVVREERVVAEDHAEEWEGVKAGEEVWNHYTDVREQNFKVRRHRLLEVLGGECQCTRCLREEADVKEKT